MNVSLTPELEKFIQKKVKSGLYQTSSEVVREALRYLQEKDKNRERKLDELRELLSPAIEASKQGKTKPLNMKEIREKAKKKWEERRSVSHASH